jgi:hypothetical protein
MKRYLSLIPILVLPVVITIYLALFWDSVKGMAIQSSGYPKLLIVAIAILLPFVVWRETADWRREQAESLSLADVWQSWHKVIYTGGSLIAFVVLLAPLGAYASSALLVGGLTFVLGYRRPVVLASLSAGAMLIVFVFSHFLGVDLPGT